MVRLLGEFVTSFNPEPSSSLRLLFSFTLNVPRSLSAWTTFVAPNLAFFSFLSFLARAAKSSSSVIPDPELSISSTCLSSSSSANPAFLRSGDPRAGLAALGCIGPSGLSDLTDGPTSVLTESSPLCLRLDFRFVDDSRSTKSIRRGVGKGGGDAARGGNGKRDNDSFSFARRRADELTWTTSSSSASGEDATSSSSLIPGKFGARESRGTCGDAFGSNMGRRAFGGGFGSNVRVGVLGVAFNDCRRKPRCLERFDVWTCEVSLGNGMPQGEMETYRSFRIRENFPRLLLFLLELCSQRNLRSTKP